MINVRMLGYNACLENIDISPRINRPPNNIYYLSYGHQNKGINSDKVEGNIINYAKRVFSQIE